MTLLLTQIFWFLLAAAVIGAVAAWYFRRNVALRREDIIQQDWRDRVRQIELDRDRAVQKLSAEISVLNKTVSQGGKSVGLVDYENLSAKLEGQITEREAAIAELRSEIQSLRGELTEARGAARQRETALLQQHEAETANLMAQLGQADNKAASKSEDALREKHQQKISRLTAQFEQQQNHALSEREDALRKKHEQEISRLTAQLEQRENHTTSARENALREKHEQEISRLTAQFEQQESQAVSAREDALRQKHEQEVSRLNAELEQQRRQAVGGDDARLAELTAEIQLRDDSIAVLRDDLAELNEHRKIDQRGRQDEQLRAAIDESIVWQEKYEKLAAELYNTKSGQTATEPPQAANDHVNPLQASGKKRERTTGDRIGSVLSHPGGPKDRLQEIKGIGPVLERRLNDVGIYHFKQIAEFDADDIARISNELGRFANRITRDEWVRQAGTLHSKYHN